MAQMPNYAEIIRQYVSVRDAVDRYTDCQARNNRIKCPIHHGEHYNMSIRDRGFHCFTCGASGDVIRFVEKLYGFPTREAMMKINLDFGLGLPIGETRDKTTKKYLDRLEEKYRKRREEQQKIIEQKRKIQDDYFDKIGALVKTYRTINEKAPNKDDEEWDDEWCDALRNRTMLEFEIRQHEALGGID